LAYVMICNHWSATGRYRTFHDVPMNRGVSTEDYRGLTSYTPIAKPFSSML
jgi:hypothetical protein